MAPETFTSHRQSDPSTTSAGRGFINTVMARIPFGYKLIDSITELNPKFNTFSDLTSDRETRLDTQSVFTPKMYDDGMFGTLFSDKSYHKLMYANVEPDKIKRLQDYRRMATYAELANCLDEISDEFIVLDDKKNVVNLTVAPEYSKIIRESIEDEWKRFISLFELRDKGWRYVRNMLIDGEIFFENIISKNHPEYGIIGVNRIPTELVNPIYDNIQNDRTRGYLLRKPIVNPKTQMVEKDEFVVLEKNQVTYINGGEWNEDKTIRLPQIDNARRAYKQLSLIEDSVIIHRLVRAPERLVFKVDTGNMNTPKSEAYIKRLMNQFWSKKTYDHSTGRISNIYEPQSYMDAFFFPKKNGTDGTTVDTVKGTSNLGTLEDLNYFQRKLYEAMKVPRGRLNSDDPYKDGTDATREELRFAKYIIRLQQSFAYGLRIGFITHLKLRKLFDEYKIKESDLDIEFNMPTMFMAIKQQQIFEIKYNNYNNLSLNEYISGSFAQEMWLGLTPEQMARNREWRRRDAAFEYEIGQITANGPAWRSQLAAAQGAAGEIAGGPSGGGGGSALPPPNNEGGENKPEGAESIPEFGPAPTEGAPAPAGGAPAQGGQPQTQPSAPAPNK